MKNLFKVLVVITMLGTVGINASLIEASSTSNEVSLESIIEQNDKDYEKVAKHKEKYVNSINKVLNKLDKATSSKATDDVINSLRNLLTILSSRDSKYQKMLEEIQ